LEELKFANDTVGEFGGLAVNFDSPIPHPYFGTDIVKPGAFAKSLATKGAQGVKMLWQHNVEEPIGRWLSLQEDAEGLKVRGQLLMELQKAREAHTLMKSGVVDGLSIGFGSSSKKNQFDPKKQERTLYEIDLFEISPVVFPADVRARIREVKSQRAS